MKQHGADIFRQDFEVLISEGFGENRIGVNAEHSGNRGSGRCLEDNND